MGLKRRRDLNMGRFSTMICPLCSRNRVTVSKKDPEIRWDYWGEESPLIQIREGGGKKPGSGKVTIGVKTKRGSTPGYGFPTVETFTLEEAINDPEYSKYVYEMIEQIEKLHEIVEKYR